MGIYKSAPRMCNDLHLNNKELGNYFYQRRLDIGQGYAGLMTLLTSISNTF